jgi:hypothetical protein
MSLQCLRQKQPNQSARRKTAARDFGSARLTGVRERFDAADGVVDHLLKIALAAAGDLDDPLCQRFQDSGGWPLPTRFTAA